MRDSKHPDGIVGRDPVDQSEWESTEQPASAARSHQGAGIRSFSGYRDNPPEFCKELIAELRNADGIVVDRVRRISKCVGMERDGTSCLGQRGVSRGVRNATTFASSCWNASAAEIPTATSDAK